MKLAYSNWHKELVHDDSIRAELNNITGGQLEFSNTPFIKHRNQNFERDDFQRGGGRWQNKKNFGGRGGGRNNRGGGRNNQGGQRGNRNDNRGNQYNRY
jgi:hypothetical protein